MHGRCNRIDLYKRFKYREKKSELPRTPAVPQRIKRAYQHLGRETRCNIFVEELSSTASSDRDAAK